MIEIKMYDNEKGYMTIERFGSNVKFTLEVPDKKYKDFIWKVDGSSARTMASCILRENYTAWSHLNCLSK